MNRQISPKFKRNLVRIIPFGLIWLLSSGVFVFNEISITHFRNINPSTDITLTIWVIIFANTAMLIVGLLVGTMEMFMLEKRLRKYRFLNKLFYKYSIYMLFFFLVILITYPIAALVETQGAISTLEITEKMIRYLGSLSFFNTMIQLSSILLLSVLYAAISEHLGHQVLLNLVSGKYHQPIIEQRIFMFLDMKASTKIAEELGHIQYFQLLRDYYDLMSDPIIQHYGEVYQYIGDEVVISWKAHRGFEKNHCINCFYALKESLHHKRAYFMDKYSHIPDFKAGLHVGEVSCGEIGALKREIVFTGDVLNTTARIQSLCKEYKSDLIISHELYAGLQNPDSLLLSDLGEVFLKGKTLSSTLYALR